MALRLVEIYGISEKEQNIKSLLKEITIYGIWQDKLPDKNTVTRLLVDSEQIEPAFNVLEEKYAKIKDFRIIALPVEACLPRPKKEEIKKHEKQTKGRISIDELYEHVINNVSLSHTFFILIILASIVASIGILYDNVAVIIGSMVIAPLIGSSIALSLATTLADKKLANKALITGISGYVIAVVIGVGFGVTFDINPFATEILSRTDVNLMYVLLAFSSGIAGAISFIKDTSQSLVGVMVAVALLPPLVVTGMLLGSHHWDQAIGSFLLFSVNMVCVNLAGVVTFLSHGMTPKKWWEKEKARKMSVKALILWIIILLVLILLSLVYHYAI